MSGGRPPRSADRASSPPSAPRAAPGWSPDARHLSAVARAADPDPGGAGRATRSTWSPRTGSVPAPRSRSRPLRCPKMPCTERSSPGQPSPLIVSGKRRRRRRLPCCGEPAGLIRTTSGSTTTGRGRRWGRPARRRRLPLQRHGGRSPRLDLAPRPCARRSVRPVVRSRLPPVPGPQGLRSGRLSYCAEQWTGREDEQDRHAWVPVIDECGCVAATILPRLGLDEAWSRLANVPRPPDDEEIPAEGDGAPPSDVYQRLPTGPHTARRYQLSGAADDATDREHRGQADSRSQDGLNHVVLAVRAVPY
jgi:hypothetical protein